MIHRISFAAAALLAAAPLYAVTYTFEPEHTQGVVRWNHLGFANPTAQFNNVQGTLEFDRADPTRSSVMVTIPLTSMSTGVAGLNQVPTVGFEAMATLKRSEFGLGLYVPQVSDEIHIHITAEAAEKNAYEQYLKAQAARQAAKKS